METTAWDADSSETPRIDLQPMDCIQKLFWQDDIPQASRIRQESRERYERRTLGSERASPEIALRNPGMAPQQLLYPFPEGLVWRKQTKN
jgi:hypothetical protein